MVEKVLALARANNCLGTMLKSRQGSNGGNCGLLLLRQFCAAFTGAVQKRKQLGCSELRTQPGRQGTKRIMWMYNLSSKYSH